MASSAEQVIDTSSIDNGLRRISQNHSSAEYTTQISNEARAYAEHIASLLPPRLTFDRNNLFAELKNGIILAHALFEIKHGCIDLRKIVSCERLADKKNLYESTANLSLVLHAVKRLGIKLINIGPEDILYENKCLVLGLLWQIVRYDVSKGSSFAKKPELMSLLDENESIDDILTKTPEEICLRWINFHLSNALKEEYLDRLRYCHNKFVNELSFKEDSVHNLQSVFNKCFKAPRNELNLEDYQNDSADNELPLTCKNFSRDLMDSRIYLILLKQIAPEIITIDDILLAWIENDLYKRAEYVLILAERLSCRQFVTAEEIVNGEHRLNFLFCQTLMNRYAGMENKIVNVDVLNIQKKEYEEQIGKLQERTKVLSEEILKKQESEKQMTEIEHELKARLDARSEEFEIAIEDLKASIDSFSYKITNRVEEMLNISISKERCDAKEKIWEIVNILIEEAKNMANERDGAIVELERLREIHRQYELKALEFVEIQKRRERERKKSWTVRDFFGCNQ
ncbi:fimbrin [Conglomerata obtusa]